MKRAQAVRVAGAWEVEEGLQMRAGRQPKAADCGWLYLEDPQHGLVHCGREVWRLHLSGHGGSE